MPNIQTPTIVSQQIVTVCEGVLLHAAAIVITETAIPVGNTGHAAYIKRIDFARAILANPKPYAQQAARLLALHFSDINTNFDQQPNLYRHLVTDNPNNANVLFLNYGFANEWNGLGGQLDKTIYNVLAGCASVDLTT